MTKPLRVGIISANWGIKCHLPAWRAVDGVEVTALCTARRETAEPAATAAGIPRAYWDYEAMVREADIDVIDIGTRPSLRYVMAKAAISAGKHVYLGVPFAATLAQAEEVNALATQAGVIGATDAYFEHIPAHAEMKRRVAAGEIGTVYSISLALQINLFNPPAAGFSYYWFADAANGASALRNLGSHSLTCLVAIFGEVEEAVGRQRQFMQTWRMADGASIAPQVPDTANILLQLRSGAMATVNISWAATGGVGWRLDAYGSKGRLSAVHAGSFPNTSAVKLFAAHGAGGIAAPVSSWSHEEEIQISSELTHSPEVKIGQDFQPAPSYPMALSFHRLKQAIDGSGTPSPDLHCGLHIERIIDAIQRSEVSGSWTKVAS